MVANAAQAPEIHLLVPEVYEPEVVNVIEHFVEPGDCAIDAGASIGFFTKLLSERVGPEGVVLAFEPHLESYRHLCRNVHLVHKLNNVACLRLALWKFDTPQLELWSVKDIGYSSFHRYKDAEYSETMEGRSLDSLLAGENQPRFIKIDCEGTEAEVLCGAHKTLERGVDCVVLEFNFYLMHNTGRTCNTIREYMHALGYDMFIIGMKNQDGTFCVPIKIEPQTEIGITGNTHYMNVMFSTEEKVKARWMNKTESSPK